MVNGIIKKLPEDLVSNILVRFPVKSLVRLKCISKSWYALIQSTTFIHLHLNYQTTIEHEFILFKHSIKEAPNGFINVLSFLSGDDDAFNPLFPDINITYMSSNFNCTFYPLVGPCHGLIVLTDLTTIILFNPATRNFRLIPPSPFGCPQGFHRSVEGIGFGFDSIAKYYKIVRISEVFWNPWDDYPGPKESKIDVYDFSMDCWREVEHVNLPLIYWLPCSEMLYKEVVHWFATTDISMVILCFDMCTEIFRIIKMPEVCNVLTNEQYYGLVILRECLTLICYPNPMSPIDPIKDKVHVWVMEEYGVSKSWILKNTIRVVPVESPLAVWKNNILLFESKNGHVISYDINSNEEKEHILHGFLASLSIIVYKECLTSIPRGSQNSSKVQNF
ncbi:F-box protein CPR1-like [Solanum verrucosum]|uniref:F-box protein CPR1-like n=1 Tax=Solanum verrucosum TaxID=315347 RepID=UPI0020D11CEB|nr:F-box protein CPR1-like [Solanum verrucosum]